MLLVNVPVIGVAPYGTSSQLSAPRAYSLASKALRSPRFFLALDLCEVLTASALRCHFVTATSTLLGIGSSATMLARISPGKQPPLAWSWLGRGAAPFRVPARVGASRRSQ